MKKVFIILILLLAATWLVAMPALVGQYVRVWVPEWLAEIEATEDSTFEPGWFRSGLELSPGNDVQARLYARHMPPIGLSWLRLDGEIDSPYSTESAQVRGHLDLDGRIRLSVNGRELAYGQQTRFFSETLAINLDQRPEGRTKLQTSFAGLTGSDHEGNRLDFDHVTATMDWRAIGQQQASLEFSVSLKHAEQVAFELHINALPLEVNALGQLIEGIRQLIGAPPDSMAQQMAFLTIAGAWQELSRHGLEIELNRLAIGPSSEFAGQWHPDRQLPHLTGQGQTDDLVGWLTPIIGLIRSVPPAQAEQLVGEWIHELVRQGLLVTENSVFEFRYPRGNDVLEEENPAE